MPSTGTNFFPTNGTVKVGLTNELGQALLIECTIANLPSAVAGYAVGCEAITSDAGAHYFNTGSATSATFTAVGTIGAGTVTLASLATAIAPSHVIKFAGQATTAGGAAAEAITVTGAVAATDRAFVQVVDNGTSNVTALQAVVTTNTLTVTFSADPGTDTIINYQIIRATS